MNGTGPPGGPSPTRRRGHIEQLATAIVGVELEITRIEGKRTMSQNRLSSTPAAPWEGLRA